MYFGKFLLTPTEAGAHLGVSAATVYNYIHKGLLKAVRQGNRAIRISLSEVERFSSHPELFGTPIQPSKPTTNYF